MIYAVEGQEYLTDREHALIGMLAEVFATFSAIVGDHINTRSRDMAEITHHVHALQSMVLAQAGARAYPCSYRLLGSVVQS